MKFDDYVTKYEELWRAIRAYETEFQGGPPPRTGYAKTSEWGSHPSHTAYDEFAKTMRREYILTARCEVSIHPQGSHDLPYAAFAKTVTEWKGELSWNTNPLPHHFQPGELRLLAEVVHVANEWAAGRLAALPPSGRWSEVR